MLLEIKLYWKNTLVLDGKTTASLAHQMVQNFIRQNFVAANKLNFTGPSLHDICMLRDNESSAPVGGMYQDETGEASYYIGRVSA